MIRVTLLDGSLQEVRREDVVGLYPVDGIFRHPLLRYDGLVFLHGKMVPVNGPFLEAAPGAAVEERPWLMLFLTHAQVIQGLPEFDDDVIRKAPELVAVNGNAGPDSIDDEEEARLLQEMEDLLKSA